VVTRSTLTVLPVLGRSATVLGRSAAVLGRSMDRLGPRGAVATIGLGGSAVFWVGRRGVDARKRGLAEAARLCWLIATSP
jgi:hypothetical protein